MPISDEEHSRRVSELLKANNREVERRRAAERALKFYGDPANYALRDFRNVPTEEVAAGLVASWPAHKFAPAVLCEGGQRAREAMQ